MQNKEKITLSLRGMCLKCSCCCPVGKPLLRRSFCCYSLHHGTVIIGIVFMLASTVAVLLEIGLIAEWPDIVSQGDGSISTAVSRPVLIVCVGLSSVYWFFSILLLKAVKKRNKRFLVPWLAWSVFSLLISLGCCIYGITLGGDTLAVRLAPPLIYFTAVLIWLYFFLCIVSFYQFLGLEDKEKAPHTNRLSMMKGEPAEEIELEAGLVGLMSEATGHGSKRVFPHSIWQERSAPNSAAGSFRVKPKGTSFKVS